MHSFICALQTDDYLSYDQLQLARVATNYMELFLNSGVNTFAPHTFYDSSIERQQQNTADMIALAFFLVFR